MVAVDDAPGLPDPLLKDCLGRDEAAAERCLGALVADVVEPVARRVSRARLRGDEAGDAEDVVAGVVVAVLTRLRAMRAGAQEPVSDLRSYVAGAAANACRDYVRARRPQRFRLKARVRYVLEHQPGFATWSDGDLRLCGFAAWGRTPGRAPASALDRVRDETLPSAPLPELIAQLFDRYGGAVEVDELVGAVARALGVEDVRPVALDEARDVASAETARDVDETSALRRLWSEIAQLPLRQRTALLLNLRDADGRDAIDLFPLTGAVSVREIAGALEMSADELAVLWPRLPLADAEIAERLSLTRQQVINLRKCARERLARRLRMPR